MPDMKELSARGHAAKAAKKAARLEQREWPLVTADGKPRDVASQDDCEVVSAWVARLVATGQMGATEGKVITIALHAWLKAHAAGRDAEKLDELQALLQELQQNARGGKGAAVMRAKGREALQRKRAREQDEDEVPPELLQRVNVVIDRILKGVGE